MIVQPSELPMQASRVGQSRIAAPVLDQQSQKKGRPTKKKKKRVHAGSARKHEAGS